MSEDTVRRDLRELAAQGLVQRVHGGALPPAPQPGSFAHRRETRPGREGRARRGRRRGARRTPRVVLLDGSTTNLELARRLPAEPPRTVLTNSPPIAAALADHPTAEVVMIGGRLDKLAQVTVGAGAVDFIRSIRADAVVLGVCALHPEAGLSTDDLEEAHVKRAMVAASADVIALATADKLRAGEPVPRRPRRRAHARRRRGRRARRPARPLPRARRHGDPRMSARWATTGVFVVNGAAIGTWVAQIPWIQERFDLSKSAMGLIIVAHGDRRHPRLPDRRPGDRPPRLGAGRLDRRHRRLARDHPPRARAARRCSWRSGCSCSARSSATQDVAMNSHGVKVEKALGRPIMSSLHAGWAFGGMAGAGARRGDPRARRRPAHLRGDRVARSCSRCSSPAPARIGHGSAAEGDDTPGFTLPSRGVVLLAILCLLVMVTEGAMADWGGLYLRQDLGASAALAALAYSFFTAGMTVGRVVGDWVNHRIGAVALLRWGALLTGHPARRDAADRRTPPPRSSGCSSSASAWRTACR